MKTEPMYDENERMMDMIGGAQPSDSDCLAIIICTYFDNHPRCPDEPDDYDLGWKPWVVDKMNETLNAIVEKIREAETKHNFRPHH